MTPEQIEDAQKTKKMIEEQLNKMTPEQQKAYIQEQVKKQKEGNDMTTYGCVFIVRAKIRQQNSTLHEIYSHYQKDSLLAAKNKIFASYAKACKANLGSGKYKEVFSESHYSR